jgi:hypothetical protein
MWQRLGNIYKESWAQLPVVQELDKEKVKIFFSKRIKGKSLPFYLIYNIAKNKILKVSREPLFRLGKPGCFDASGIMPTSILRKGKTLILYYVGWTERKDVPFHNALGAATSHDEGRSWKKLSAGPIFTSSINEPGFIGTIEVVKRRKQYFGIYLSCRRWLKKNKMIEPIYDLKIAKSKDAVNWKPFGTAIRNKKNEGGLCRASIIKGQKRYFMWYCSRSKNDYRNNPKNSYKIHCATSKNLLTWVRTSKYSLRNNNNYLNENIMVAYPCIIKKNKSLYMFYNGNKFGKTGVFAAKMEVSKLEK